MQSSPKNPLSLFLNNNKQTSAGQSEYKDMSLQQSDIRTSEKSFSISKNITEIKERRKLMESNAQLLLNRLQALSQEEYKLKKNAFDLKKRSQELLQHRMQREKQKAVDEKQTQQREKVKNSELEDLRKHVNQAKAKANAEAAKSWDLLVEQRRKEAQAIREQRLANQEKIVQAKVEHINKQKVRSLKVKEMEEKATQRIKEYHKIKEEMMREERERLVREEEERILEKEREIELLAQEEDARLERLNKAEEDESNALNQYDEISKLPIDNLAQKYNYYLKSQHSSPKLKTGGDYSVFASKTMQNNQQTDYSPLALRSFDNLRKSQVAP